MFYWILDLWSDHEGIFSFPLPSKELSHENYPSRKLWIDIISSSVQVFATCSEHTVRAISDQQPFCFSANAMPHLVIPVCVVSSKCTQTVDAAVTEAGYFSD